MELSWKWKSRELLRVGWYEKPLIAWWVLFEEQRLELIWIEAFSVFKELKIANFKKLKEIVGKTNLLLVQMRILSPVLSLNFFSKHFKRLTSLSMLKKFIKVKFWQNQIEIVKI